MQPGAGLPDQAAHIPQYDGGADEAEPHDAESAGQSAALTTGRGLQGLVEGEVPAAILPGSPAEQLVGQLSPAAAGTCAYAISAAGVTGTGDALAGGSSQTAGTVKDGPQGHTSADGAIQLFLC